MNPEQILILVKHLVIENSFKNNVCLESNCTDQIAKFEWAFFEWIGQKYS